MLLFMLLYLCSCLDLDDASVIYLFPLCFALASLGL